MAEISAPEPRSRQAVKTPALLRQFELRLLAELGYAINLEEDCKSHQLITADCKYRFMPDVGFEQCIESKSNDSSSREYQGAHLIALREMKLTDPGAARAAKRLLRQALTSHLGEKPLHSRNLFN